MADTKNARRWKRRDKRSDKKPQKEFEEVLLEVRRVTRVTTGGRQLSFRAIILIGNKKGKIGLGVAKWSDVSIAVQKATHSAYKDIMTVPVTENASIPYETTHKYKAAKIKLLPAAPGTGLKAWSSVRTVLTLAGYTNILSKIMWTNNKLNNAIAAIQALARFKAGKFPKKMKSDEDNQKLNLKKETGESKNEKVVEKKTPTKKVPAKKVVATKTPAKKTLVKKTVPKKQKTTQ